MLTGTILADITIGRETAIPGVHWCEPVGWEPRNDVGGGEWCPIECKWIGDAGGAVAAVAVICPGDCCEGARMAVGVEQLVVVACDGSGVIAGVMVDFE